MALVHRPGSLQLQSLCSPPTNDYCLLTEVVAVHTEALPAGMTTYQVIFQAQNPTDFVTTVSEDVSNPKRGSKPRPPFTRISWAV